MTELLVLFHYSASFWLERVSEREASNARQWSLVQRLQ